MTVYDEVEWDACQWSVKLVSATVLQGTSVEPTQQRGVH